MTPPYLVATNQLCIKLDQNYCLRSRDWCRGVEEHENVNDEVEKGVTTKLQTLK